MKVPVSYNSRRESKPHSRSENPGGCVTIEHHHHESHKERVKHKDRGQTSALLCVIPKLVFAAPNNV